MVLRYYLDDNKKKEMVIIFLIAYSLSKKQIVVIPRNGTCLSGKFFVFQTLKVMYFWSSLSDMLPYLRLIDS